MAIVERLAKHVADFGVLYTKIHNYHWHVGGLNFLVIHQMTDGYYEDVADSYDSLELQMATTLLLNVSCSWAAPLLLR